MVHQQQSEGKISAKPTSFLWTTMLQRKKWKQSVQFPAENPRISIRPTVTSTSPPVIQNVIWSSIDPGSRLW